MKKFGPHGQKDSKKAAFETDPVIFRTARFKLQAGEMVVFDNRRILHGRDAFDPSTGHRLLKGFYVDRGEFDSKIRMLAYATDHPPARR